MPEPASPPGSGAPYVPYQAYRSKRHSRTISNPSPHLTPNVSPPPISRPSSVVGTPVSSPQLHATVDREKDVMPVYVFSSEATPLPQSSPTPRIILDPAPPGTREPMSNGLSLHPTSTNSHDSRDSAHEYPLLQVSAAAASPMQTMDTQSVNASSASLSAHSTMPLASSSTVTNTPRISSQTKDDIKLPLTPPTIRKTSTFRRVPPRNTRGPLPSSPLRADHNPTPSHAPTVSVSSNNSPRPTPRVSVTLHSSGNEPIPRGEVEPANHQPSFSGSVSPSIPERTLSPISNSELNVIDSTTFTSAITSPPLSKSTSTSSQISGFHPPSTLQTRSSAPYRPGFQPKGVYRPLTDEFIALRREKRDGNGESGSMSRVERTKLERRLEKLVALHFPPEDRVSKGHSESTDKERPSIGAVQDNRRASSFFDLQSLRSMRVNDAGDLWRGVLSGGLGDTVKADIRAAEQRITPWEDDAAISKCPLCGTSFHPLTNRKHHCRLCGKIICSLPPKHPQRPSTCSLLFVVDSKTRQIEEVGEGVDYGVRKRRTSEQTKHGDEEKFLKGVRVCRDCWPILLRQQYLQEIQHVPASVQLYETFLSLEKDIEEALPQFQELILSLNHNDQPTKEASSARKRLLEAFAQYDALSKRIRKLPCPNGPGSSQDRVQMAIQTRANLFLQKNMFPLQSLPTPDRSSDKAPGSSSLSLKGGRPEQTTIDPESELAYQLQPLLEQEALLESFVEEAKAHRKFEDVKTLKANLGEIRSEIEKVLDNSERENQANGIKRGKPAKGP